MVPEIAGTRYKSLTSEDRRITASHFSIASEYLRLSRWDRKICDVSLSLNKQLFNLWLDTYCLISLDYWNIFLYVEYFSMSTVAIFSIMSSRCVSHIISCRNS